MKWLLIAGVVTFACVGAYVALRIWFWPIYSYVDVMDDTPPEFEYEEWPSDE